MGSIYTHVRGMCIPPSRNDGRIPGELRSKLRLRYSSTQITHIAWIAFADRQPYPARTVLVDLDHRVLYHK